MHCSVIAYRRLHATVRLTAAVSFMNLRRLERQVQEWSRAYATLTLTCDISINFQYFLMKFSDNVIKYMISIVCEFR